MSSSPPPPVPSADSEPGPAPTLPGVALWSDSDPPPISPTSPAPFSGLVATPGDRAIPTIGHIGRYALKYQLGEGGLGTVFAAHDPLLSRLIAVKTLNVQVAEEERESFNALFLNEARAAGGLSHPHIVTVFDAGISDQRAYIAMELLKGRDLRQLRQEGWRATPAQAALIIRRVADALAFAHSKGVIHRDIKPANIFMVGRTQPRVLDFGIARVAHRQDSDDPHSGAGSPYYMAPEQVRRELADRRADVFSLGVVLYELLTDQKPFRGETLAQIREAVLHHEPPLANKVDPTVPKALAAIAARAMAKDPEQRFRSARSFARELRQWLDDNPTSPDGEKTAPAAPEPRRLPVMLGVVAAATVAAVVAAVATWFALAPTSTQAEATPLESRATQSVQKAAAAATGPEPAAPSVAPVSGAPTALGAEAGSAAPGGGSATIAAPGEALAAAATTTTGVAAPASTAPAALPQGNDSLLMATLLPTPPSSAPRRRRDVRRAGSDRRAHCQALDDTSGRSIARIRQGPSRPRRARTRGARERGSRRRGGEVDRPADRHREDRHQPVGPGGGRRRGLRGRAPHHRADAGRGQAPDRRPQR